MTDEKCHYCKAKLGRDNHTVDHIVPLSKGGEDSGWNKVPACVRCNSRKGNKWPTCLCKTCTQSRTRHRRMGTTIEGPREGWIPPGKKKRRATRLQLAVGGSE